VVIVHLMHRVLNHLKTGDNQDAISSSVDQAVEKVRFALNSLKTMASFTFLQVIFSVLKEIVAAKTLN